MQLHSYSSIDVANYILEKAEKEKKSLTPMQIIKIVYLCHGWMLGLYDRPLIKEPIEAWKYGPVIKDLYQKVKKYRSNPIDKKLDENTLPNFSQEEQSIMDQVFDKYSNLSGITLSSLTHAEGTPWSNTWKPQMKELIISNDLIEDHFKQLYQNTAGSN